jgi:hypothetical protein
VSGEMVRLKIQELFGDTIEPLFREAYKQVVSTGLTEVKLPFNILKNNSLVGAVLYDMSKKTFQLFLDVVLLRHNRVDASLFIKKIQQYFYYGVSIKDKLNQVKLYNQDPHFGLLLEAVPAVLSSKFVLTFDDFQQLCKTETPSSVRMVTITSLTNLIYAFPFRELFTIDCSEDYSRVHVEFPK